MISISKNKLIYDISKVNKNYGFLKQIKEDDDVLLAYAIRRKFIKVVKSELRREIKENADLFSREDMTKFLVALDTKNPYISSKCLFVLRDRGILTLSKKRLRKRDTRVPITSSSLSRVPHRRR